MNIFSTIHFEYMSYFHRAQSTRLLVSISHFWLINLCIYLSLFYFFSQSYVIQQTRDVVPMLGQRWASVVDGGPALAQLFVFAGDVL